MVRVFVAAPSLSARDTRCLTYVLSWFYIEVRGQRLAKSVAANSADCRGLRKSRQFRGTRHYIEGGLTVGRSKTSFPRCPTDVIRSRLCLPVLVCVTSLQWRSRSRTRYEPVALVWIWRHCSSAHSLFRRGVALLQFFHGLANTHEFT